MNIVAIDDEKLALEALVCAIEEALPKVGVKAFRDPNELMGFAKENGVDIAFLDIEMRGINGLELAKRLKKSCPLVNIIFVTGYSQYALDSFSLRASGYLLKPVTAAHILEELEHLRNPLPQVQRVINWPL